MIRVFTGYDPRESIGHAVFVHSLLEHASKPLQITPLAETGMPAGSNAFTYSRFLVPWLCNFEGHALFLDGSDMLMQADIDELDALFDPQYAVQVVQRPDYRTKHPIKYRGTTMQCPNRDYTRKNWASVMLINCEHRCWPPLTPSTVHAVAGLSPLSLLQFKGLQLHESEGLPAEVGPLPDRWNRLVDEGDPVDGAAVLHWTAGGVFIPAYNAAPGADLWRAARDRMLEVP